MQAVELNSLLCLSTVWNKLHRDLPFYVRPEGGFSFQNKNILWSIDNN